MITMAFFRIFITVVNGIVGQIPTAASLGIPDVSGAVATISDLRIWQYFAWANHYLPVDLALGLLAVRFTIWGVLYGIELTIWLLTKAHILGGSST